MRSCMWRLVCTKIQDLFGVSQGQSQKRGVTHQLINGFPQNKATYSALSTDALSVEIGRTEASAAASAVPQTLPTGAAAASSAAAAAAGARSSGPASLPGCFPAKIFQGLSLLGAPLFCLSLLLRDKTLTWAEPNDYRS